jgi:hypothetical protein
MIVILLIIKLLSLATTGILGLSGLVHDYKDKDGRLTQKGRRAVVGIIVSSVLSVSILGLEEYKAIDSATESAKRLEETAKKQEAISEQIGTNLHYTIGISEGMTASANSLQFLLDKTSGITSDLAKSASTSEDILTKQLRALREQQRFALTQQTMFAHLTGENSFCYLSPDIVDDELNLMLFREGKYPVYDVHIYVAEKLTEEPKTYAPGAIGVLPRYIDKINLPKTDRLSLFIIFETRYNIFVQVLKLARVNGQWKFAYRVVNATKQMQEVLKRIDEDGMIGPFLPETTEPQILRESIHSDFPTIKGKVSFDVWELFRPS